MGLFNKRVRKEKKSILVRSGVDVKKNQLSSDKGEYFSGADDQYQTYVVETKASNIWHIHLTDLNKQKIYHSKFRSELWIGREEREKDTHSFLCFKDDSQISKIHCALFVRNDSLYIKDMHSRNHTYLNGIKIVRAAPIKNGDVIWIGKKILKIQIISS